MTYTPHMSFHSPGNSVFNRPKQGRSLENHHETHVIRIPDSFSQNAKKEHSSAGFATFQHNHRPRNMTPLYPPTTERAKEIVSHTLTKGEDTTSEEEARPSQQKCHFSVYFDTIMTTFKDFSQAHSTHPMIYNAHTRKFTQYYLHYQTDRLRNYHDQTQ